MTLKYLKLVKSIIRCSSNGSPVKIYTMRKNLRLSKELLLLANPNLVRESSIMHKNGASASSKKRNTSKISCNLEKRVAYKRFL